MEPDHIKILDEGTSFVMAGGKNHRISRLPLGADFESRKQQRDYALKQWQRIAIMGRLRRGAADTESLLETLVSLSKEINAIIEQAMSLQFENQEARFERVKAQFAQEKADRVRADQVLLDEIREMFGSNSGEPQRGTLTPNLASTEATACQKSPSESSSARMTGLDGP